MVIGSSRWYLHLAFPVTGGFSRTAVNAQAGARSQASSLISAAVIGVTLLFLTPLFYHLPKAILALQKAYEYLMDKRNETPELHVATGKIE